eukprot:14488694-Alexandrium_andersonii.AAC.1
MDVWVSCGADGGQGGGDNCSEYMLVVCRVLWSFLVPGCVVPFEGLTGTTGAGICSESLFSDALRM